MIVGRRVSTHGARLFSNCKFLALRKFHAIIASRDGEINVRESQGQPGCKSVQSENFEATAQGKARDRVLTFTPPHDLRTGNSFTLQPTKYHVLRMRTT